ncbi:MAG TPA: DUF3043 domain-containing protein [Trebonia sp.]|nr:DUF3043 domain-containing protein [Trebonia sp.]
MFRRSSAGATEGQAQDSQPALAPEAPAKSKPPEQTGKGRPTPKRSEAEAGRYRSLTGSTTSGRNRSSTAAPPSRKLTPEEKAKVRAERNKQVQAMRRGEEWALQPRDRGKVKQLARDYVDAHRRPSEFYMYALIILVISLIAGKAHKALNSDLQFLLLAIIAIIIVDALLLRRSIKKLAAERLPGESTRGITFYAIMRALQLRRFRNPAPRIKPGDSF